MEETIDLFVRYLKNQKNYSEHTVVSYKQEVEVFYQYILDQGIESFEKVDYPLVRKYLVVLKKKNLHASTIRHHLSALRTFYHYLIFMEITDHNPFELLSLPKMEQRLPEFLYPDEIDQLLEGIDLSTPLGIRNSMIIELLYATGIRCQEACDIRLRDIDFDRQMIYIHGKGNKNRYVPFNDICKICIEDYIEDARVSLMKEKNQDYLLVNRQGDPLTTRGVRDIIERVSQKSTLNKKVHPHMFRHTFATHMLDAGASLRVVQDILGHEELSSTQVYTHVSMDRLANQIEAHHPSSKKSINEKMFKK